MSEHYVINFEPGLWGVCYRDAKGRLLTIAECFEVETAERIATALNAQAGWLEQHARDGAELRRLCEARDQYKNEVTRLEVCLTEAVDNVVALRAELQNIADAKPHTWDAEVRDQFKEWAQSRARAALAAVREKGRE